MTSIWTVSGVETSRERLGALTPQEILVDVDGPRVFVARTSDDEDLLLYQCAEDANRTGWVAVPTDARLVDALREGRLALLDALRQPWGWFVTQTLDGTVQRVVRVRLGDLPPASLPAPGVTLVEPEPPFLAVRAVGSAFSKGTEVPASVVRKVIEGAMHAMKTLVEDALAMTGSDGRPTDNLRQYYDLPTQRLAFGSFEAVFGEPTPPAARPLLPGDQDALARAGRVLRRGIEELGRAPDDDVALDEEVGTALDALSKLLPPATGLIEEVQLRGRLLGPAPVQLSREHGARARRLLRRSRVAVEPVVTVEGAVRELDRDLLTFLVRSPDLQQQWACRASPAQRDDVENAFAEAYPVAVSGHRKAPKGTIEVIAIEPLG